MNAVRSVLIVDDEPAVRDLMARWVTSLGLTPTTAGSADEALQTLRTRRHQLAVIDVLMPGRNGLWLAEELQRESPDTAVVIATAHTELLTDAPQDGPIADYLIKPFRRERFVQAVDRGCEWRRHSLAESHWCAQLALELRDGVDAVHSYLTAQQVAGVDEGAALVTLAAARIPEVMAHSERVVRFAVALARELRIDGATLDSVESAARFHDIGKLAMPESLLTKPSKLEPGEAAIMRRHVEAGSEMLEWTTSLKDVAPIVRATHEWFGGGGYPSQLAGEAIPLASRVVSVADAYDTMTQTRPYRNQLNASEAVGELIRCAPSQFDPAIVQAFLSLLARH
jgi:putative nucleotidyltransferase with HDIG domain